jgi:putative sigma-54 modulation protein
MNFPGNPGASRGGRLTAPPPRKPKLKPAASRRFGGADKEEHIMRFQFTGKNINVTEHTKERFQQKIGRLERLLPKDAEVGVTFSVVKQEHTVEVTIPLQRRVLRAEVTAGDLFSAIDEVVDVLDKQMVKYKNRLKHKSRRDSAFKAEMSYFGAEESQDEPEAGETDIRFEKTKRFSLKPMDEEEAVMEMEMLGHTFFVFRNSKSDAVNVVYRRRNGSYGLIDPEY